MLFGSTATIHLQAENDCPEISESQKISSLVFKKLDNLTNELAQVRKDKQLII